MAGSRRHRALSVELGDLDKLIAPLVIAINPAQLAVHGIGVQVAAQLLVTAGDNPDRLHSEAAFAMLCGVAPLPASSGKINRHRLNRGGDRDANCPTWPIAVTRLATDPRTRDYHNQRQKEGLSKPEILPCLKPYIAHGTYPLLTTHHPAATTSARSRHAPDPGSSIPLPGTDCPQAPQRPPGSTAAAGRHPATATATLQAEAAAPHPARRPQPVTQPHPVDKPQEHPDPGVSSPTAGGPVGNHTTR